MVWHVTKNGSFLVVFFSSLSNRRAETFPFDIIDATRSRILTLN